MVLTDRQMEGVIRLFSKAFVSAADDDERKKILIEFEDSFGRNISDWKMICKEQIEALTTNAEILATYEKFINRKETRTQDMEYEIRGFREEDIPAVRELLNQSFDMHLTLFDDKKFEKYLKSGYSYVICTEGSVLGVILAFAIPNLITDAVYIDNFVVAKPVRGCGIGRQLFKKLCNKVHEDGIYSLRLQTEKTREAYEIYKHWGFEEVDMVQMRRYVIR